MPIDKRQSSRSKQSKSRTIVDLLLISGVNNVRECLASPHANVLQLIVKKGFDLEQLGRIPKEIKQVWLSEQDPRCDEIHQGIGCQLPVPNWGDYQTFIENLVKHKKDPVVVILDQVEDPNNLGQILRTSDGAGVDAVLVPGRRSAPLTSAAAQTSQGAFAWVPFFNVGNLRQALDFLKNNGFWLYACENDAASKLWSESDLCGPVTVIFGSEGRGIRQLTLQSCDHTLHLPMAGKINSLNVSASVSAVLFEIVRQRQKS